MRKIDKTNTVTKIKTEVKKSAFDFFEKILTENGFEGVRMIRQKKKNELAFIFDNVEKEDGITVPIIVTINPTVKDFVDRQTPKKFTPAFDFAAATNEFDEWAAEKEEDRE